MNLIPIISEKTIGLAKDGKFTFRVEKGLTKPKIKEVIEKVFGVSVVSVRTANVKGETKRNNKGYRRTAPTWKKAVVTLKKDQKIDLFETKEK